MSKTSEAKIVNFLQVCYLLKRAGIYNYFLNIVFVHFKCRIEAPVNKLTLN